MKKREASIGADEVEQAIKSLHAQAERDGLVHIADPKGFTASAYGRAVGFSKSYAAAVLRMLLLKGAVERCWVRDSSNRIIEGYRKRERATR